MEQLTIVVLQMVGNLLLVEAVEERVRVEEQQLLSRNVQMLIMK